jgi:alkylated DNA nucleotide flippase Atl1
VGRFVIPAPREVDALMKQIPRGRVATINELRAALAAKHKVNFACPLTTGIFSWIAAHAAAEAEAAGVKRITPFWRTLKTGGEINPKYPGGAEAVAKRLRAEGHTIVTKGKRVLVAEVEKRLFTKLK